MQCTLFHSPKELPNIFGLGNVFNGTDLELFAGTPPHFLPSHVRLLPAEEQAQRTYFWCSAMFFEIASTCLLGTLIMSLKRRKKTGHPGAYHAFAEGDIPYVGASPDDASGAAPQKKYQKREKYV